MTNSFFEQFNHLNISLVETITKPSANIMTLIVFKNTRISFRYILPISDNQYNWFRVGI